MTALWFSKPRLDPTKPFAMLTKPGLNCVLVDAADTQSQLLQHLRKTWLLSRLLLQPPVLATPLNPPPPLLVLDARP